MKNIGRNKLTAFWHAHPRLAFALLLIIVNLAVILLFTCILAIISGNSFGEELAYIFTFTMSSDGVYDFVEKGEDIACFILKIVLVVVQMVVFSGALIGFTTDVLQTTMDKTINNMGKIKLEDHYVFLNWSSIGPRIIYDLSYLDGQKNIVILADKNRNDIITSIQNIFTENKRRMKNITLFVKRGNPMSLKHLYDVSLDKARSIGVMLTSVENSGDYYMTAKDLNALKTLFTMMNIGIQANIVLEAEENNTTEKIENLFDTINPELNKRIVVFSHDSVVGHIMGRSIVNPTFIDVFNELLSYDGVEFYGIPVRDVEDALYSFNQCIPIINYDDDDEIDEFGQKAPDQLYVLAESEDAILERPQKKSFVRPLKYHENRKHEAFSVFIISNTGNDKFVVEELDKYGKLANIDIKFYSYTYNDDLKEIKKTINATEGERKILLLSSANNNDAMQDAEVFLTAMDLRMGGLDKEVSIYAEIFNPSNMQALQNIGVVSVIVSNKIISLFMVQLLTHPSSRKFYRDLISINDDEGDGDDALDIDIIKAKELLVFDEGELHFSCQSEFVQSFFFASGKKKICIGIKHVEDKRVRFLCNDMDSREDLVIYPDDDLVLAIY